MTKYQDVKTGKELSRGEDWRRCIDTLMLVIGLRSSKRQEAPDFSWPANLLRGYGLPHL